MSDQVFAQSEYMTFLYIYITTSSVTVADHFAAAPQRHDGHRCRRCVAYLPTAGNKEKTELLSMLDNLRQSSRSLVKVHNRVLSKTDLHIRRMGRKGTVRSETCAFAVQNQTPSDIQHSPRLYSERFGAQVARQNGHEMVL